jgi:hypothetical protein
MIGPFLMYETEKIGKEANMVFNDDNAEVTGRI